MCYRASSRKRIESIWQLPAKEMGKHSSGGSKAEPGDGLWVGCSPPITSMHRAPKKHRGGDSSSPCSYPTSKEQCGMRCWTPHSSTAQLHHTLLLSSLSADLWLLSCQLSTFYYSSHSYFPESLRVWAQMVLCQSRFSFPLLWEVAGPRWVAEELRTLFQVDKRMERVRNPKLLGFKT